MSDVTTIKDLIAILIHLPEHYLEKDFNKLNLSIDNDGAIKIQLEINNPVESIEHIINITPSSEEQEQKG